MSAQWIGMWKRSRINSGDSGTIWSLGANDRSHVRGLPCGIAEHDEHAGRDVCVEWPSGQRAPDTRMRVRIVASPTVAKSGTHGRVKNEGRVTGSVCRGEEGHTRNAEREV